MLKQCYQKILSRSQFAWYFALFLSLYLQQTTSSWYHLNELNKIVKIITLTIGVDSTVVVWDKFFSSLEKINSFPNLDKISWIGKEWQNPGIENTSQMEEFVIKCKVKNFPANGQWSEATLSRFSSLLGEALKGVGSLSLHSLPYFYHKHSSSSNPIEYCHFFFFSILFLKCTSPIVRILLGVAIISQVIVPAKGDKREKNWSIR